jgi:hypothetical protein
MVSLAPPLPEEERVLEERGNFCFFGGGGDLMEMFYVIMVHSGIYGFEETVIV